jgi:hypothetical protein
MTVRWHPAGGRGRLKALVAERVRERIDPGDLAQVSAAERRLRVREEALGVLREHRVVMPALELTGLVNEVSDEVVGLGAIEGLLRDPEITERLVNIRVPRRSGGSPQGCPRAPRRPGGRTRR